MMILKKKIRWLYDALLRKYYMRKIGYEESQWIKRMEDLDGWSLHNNLIATRDRSGIHGYLNTDLNVLYSKQGLMCFKFGPDYGSLRKNAVDRLRKNLTDNRGIK